KDALPQMARVAAATDVPVIADESVATLADLERVVEAKAADGVNLKLAKSGGLLPALAVGEAAREHGLSVMVGGMVETRLGMSAMGQVAGALGGVSFVDLDTAWLLARDPFAGGYRERGPRYELPDEPGLGLEPR
ncbi:MAG: enolase C-terminal domain-like protein, partial [Polyangiales bacterium]